MVTISPGIQQQTELALICQRVNRVFDLHPSMEVKKGEKEGAEKKTGQDDRQSKELGFNRTESLETLRHFFCCLSRGR